MIVEGFIYPSPGRLQLAFNSFFFFSFFFFRGGGLLHDK
jgi:hypothetical protein